MLSYSSCYFIKFPFSVCTIFASQQMEHAQLEVAHLKPRKVLLQYGTAAHQEKLRHQPHLYAASSAEDRETVADDARVAAYTDLLNFITGAQQECYALFGDDEGRWTMDDGAAEEPASSSTRGSSLRVNSNEWSEDDNTADGAAGRKRKRQNA